VHQQRLPGLQVGEQVDVGPDGARGLHQPARVDQVQPVRHRHHLPGGDRDPLRVTATGQQRADPVASRPAGHPRAQLGDGAGNLQAEVLRRARRRRVGAFPLQQVGAVDPGRGNVHDELTGAGDRIRDLLPGQLIGTTGGPHDDCMHAAGRYPVHPTPPVSGPAGSAE